MKKPRILRLAHPALLGGVLLCFLPYSIALILFLTAFEVGDEHLLTSASPTGAYVLEVHRINPGATEPFSIHVFRIDGEHSERIYAARGEDEAELVWLSGDTVRINTVALDLAARETYTGDLDDPEAVKVIIDVQAEGVSGFEMEYAIGRQLLGGQSVAGVWDPGQAFRSGDTFTFSFEHRRDIPLFESLRDGAFGVIPTVYTAGGALQLPFLYEWAAEWEQTRRFTLTGSADSGFTLTPADAGCAVLPLSEAFPAE